MAIEQQFIRMPSPPHALRGEILQSKKGLSPTEYAENHHLFILSRQTIVDLSTNFGFRASDTMYPNPFVRDQATACLQILETQKFYNDPELLSQTKLSLASMLSYQADEVNPHNGAEPGKLFHEIRWDNHDHLTNPKNGEKPWYIDPKDNIMKNYDSIDATPLALSALHNYYKVTGDGAFLMDKLSHAEKGLRWMLTDGDKDNDGFLEYDTVAHRKYGGLVTQNWTDSKEFNTDSKGNFHKYPIAPVEVQGMAWKAYMEWGNFYRNNPTLGREKKEFGEHLLTQADKMKKAFNDPEKGFLMKDKGLTYLATALDGDKKQIVTITGNPLMISWSSYKNEQTGETDSIVHRRYWSDIITRGFMPDMFHPLAGFRTMSTESPTYNPKINSYHNGPAWVHQNGIITEGLRMWGENKKADLASQALLTPVKHFNTCLELTIVGEDSSLRKFRNHSQDGCDNQLWAATTVYRESARTLHGLTSV